MTTFADNLQVGGPIVDDVASTVYVSTHEHGLRLRAYTFGLSELGFYDPPNASAASIVRSHGTDRTYLMAINAASIAPGPCLLLTASSAGVAVDNLTSDFGLADYQCDARILTIPAPVGIPTASVNGSHVTLSWRHPGNVQAFEVMVGIASGIPNLTLNIDGAESSLDVVGVPAGTYYVRVAGKNDLGKGPASPELRVVVP